MTESSPPPSTRFLLYLATYASVATAVLLIGVKFGAWLVTGSLSVLASLVDSVMDAAVSMINLLAVRYSLKSADREHRFGHGKAEFLAGLGQAAFIACSALFLVASAVNRLLHPRELAETGAGIAIMLFAIAATIVLLVIQRYVIHRTQSTAIKADSLHYSTDLLTNLGTIIALLFTGNGMAWVDPLIALLIALFILYSAAVIGHESVQMLMDRELPAHTLLKIRNLACTHPLVIGVHDLRTRKSGQTCIVQLHLELEDSMPLVEAHAVAKEVERRIMERYPGADVTIHQDPVSRYLVGKQSAADDARLVE